jgi:hypothetical protein
MEKGKRISAVKRTEFISDRMSYIVLRVGLERVPLSLVSTIKELLERKSSGSSLEIRGFVRGDPLL